MRSLVTISVLGASILNSSTGILPQVEVDNIQPTNIQTAQQTIDISNKYSFDKSDKLGSVSDNLKSFKEDEVARYQKEVEEAKRKAAEEEARRKQEEAERQVRIEAERKAAQEAAAKAARAQASRPSAVIPSGGIKNEAYNLVKSLGYSDQDWAAIDFIINKESTWNPNAVNPSSGACGLAQVLPCTSSKFNTYASSDYKTNWQTQVKWMINYSNARYGSIQGAYQFWLVNNWY